MWSITYIDRQLTFRLKTNKIKIDISERKFTGGKFTHTYSFKGKQILAFNRYPDGSVRNNNFNIASYNIVDWRGAIEKSGRKKSWGKRLIISKCGSSDMEKFNYISELLYQVIKQLY